MNWFRPRARNRYYRHDLRGLDSRVRAKLRSRRQMRLLGVGILGMMLLGGLTYGFWHVANYSLKRLFTENETYQIRDISIESTGESLQREQMLNYLHLVRNQNLLSIDLGKIRREMELLPMVEHAEVSRELPNRLLIRITERVPIAGISVSEETALYQIDRYGVVMDLVPYQRNPQEFQKKLELLPRIVGADVSDLKMGRAVTSTPIRRALVLIQMMSQIEQEQKGFLKDTPIEIQRVDVSRHDVLWVKLAEGTLVKIGYGEMDQQIRRLTAILDHARRQSLRPESIDLTVGRDVPVVFASNF